MNQITDKLIMVRPVNFGFNPETALDNAFQSQIEGLNSSAAQSKALKEFDEFVSLLENKGISVQVFEDRKDPFTPDSIFPNNWFTTHEDGTIITYPMYSESRRKERRDDILNSLASTVNKTKRYGFEYFEDEHKFLEGTGSMILDRENRIAYACLSERTNIELLEKFCVLKNYQKMFFYALDETGKKIYHTNVMMTLGENFALICMESVQDEEEQKKLRVSLEQSNKEIIEITYKQMNSFAGNMLQAKNKAGDRFVIMSNQALTSLNEDQINRIQRHGEIIAPILDTIETLGGGSARCMLAENFLS